MAIPGIAPEVICMPSRDPAIDLWPIQHIPLLLVLASLQDTCCVIQSPVYYIEEVHYCGSSASYYSTWFLEETAWKPSPVTCIFLPSLINFWGVFFRHSFWKLSVSFSTWHAPSQEPIRGGGMPFKRVSLYYETFPSANRQFTVAHLYVKWVLVPLSY